MNNNTFFENLRKETTEALSKVFDKVEEVSKVSALKLKISNLKGKIKDHKTEIGEFIVLNKKKFSEFSEINEILANIKLLEEQIEVKKERIDKLQEKKKNEADVKEGGSRSSL